ncbi:hypothetical protein PAE4_30427 [Bacillus altitudinis]|nr:hypothetical protein PAE4_30427 [Bacillus altitudinis]VXB38944.1 hypothetical protein BACI9J_130773 [Bacillus altitudinis]
MYGDLYEAPDQTEPDEAGEDFITGQAILKKR